MSSIAIDENVASTGNADVGLTIGLIVLTCGGVVFAAKTVPAPAVTSKVKSMPIPITVTCKLDNFDTLSVSITNTKTGAQVTVKRTLLSNRPTNVFTANLDPGASYTITGTGSYKQRSGSNKTDETTTASKLREAMNKITGGGATIKYYTATKKIASASGPSYDMTLELK